MRDGPRDRAAWPDALVRKASGRPGHRRRCPGGRGLRVPGAEWSRQDHDDPDAPGPDPPDIRRGLHLRPGRVETGTGVPSEARPPGQRPRLPRRPQCRPAPRSRRGPARRGQGRVAAARRTPRARLKRRYPQALARQSPEGRRRPGLHGQRAAARDGRAVNRPRPAHAAGIPRAGGRGACRRSDGLPLVAQPPGGGARVRPRGHHPGRSDRQDRHSPGPRGRPHALGEPGPRPARPRRRVPASKRDGALEHGPGRPPDGPWRHQRAVAGPGRARSPRHRHLHARRRGRVLPLLRRHRRGLRRTGRPTNLDKSEAVR